MIEVDRAVELLLDAVRPLGYEQVALDEAHGRTLAEPVVADRDFPPTDRSAMDGYAVRSADVAGDETTTLEVIGEIRAGQPAPDRPIGPGQAVRIMTGAIVPQGADAVVMVEDTAPSPDGRSVEIRGTQAAGRHIRRRAQDLAAGDTVLQPGVEIRAPQLAALAAVGLQRVRVVRRPVVHVLSTGDEIVEPAQTPAAHQVRNSNAPLLLAELRELGIEGHYLGIGSDRRDRLEAAFARGLAGDCLVITGGVSVGKYDLVADVLAAAGVERLFHKVAMKPGKPVLAGRRGGCLVVGLPGNPVSTLVGFSVLATPALRRMMGLHPSEPPALDVELARSLAAKAGRRTYHLALVRQAGGRLVGEPVRTTGSGDVLSMAQANALLITPSAGGTFPEGSRVPCLFLRGFV